MPVDQHHAKRWEATEPEVQTALAQLLSPGQIFYDLGANVRSDTVLASKLVGTSGHVYAFEPEPTNLRAIYHNLDLSRPKNVTVVPCAVSDRVGLCNFRLSKELFWGRLDCLPPPPHPRGTIEVYGVNIDILVAEGFIRPPSVVKIDMGDSQERCVLVGMRETLRRYHPAIICELRVIRGMR